MASPTKDLACVISRWDASGLRGRPGKRDRTWKPGFDRGYPEYCAALFEPAAPVGLSKRTRKAVIAGLEAGRGRRVYKLEGDGIERAARLITRTRPAGRSPAPSRPRTARK